MQQPGSSAIILAGGKSRRMGQDKALLSYRGMTLLEHTVSTMLTLVSDIVVVADVTDKYALPYGRVIADLFPDSGPVGGIVTGLAHVGEGRHYVVACDMPALNPNLLALLMKAAEPPADVVAPEINGLLEPLCAVYLHTATPKLLRFLEEGGRAARDALSILITRRIEEGILCRVDPGAMSLSNINTPQDLERFLKRTE